MSEAPCLPLQLSDCTDNALAAQAQGGRSDGDLLHFILICCVPLGHVMFTTYSYSNVANFHIKRPNMIEAKQKEL